MSTFERIHEVQIEDLPPEYAVTFHELRGYDSPDRWYELSYRGSRIQSEFESAEEAAKAAFDHIRRKESAA